MQNHPASGRAFYRALLALAAPIALLGILSGSLLIAVSPPVYG